MVNQSDIINRCMELRSYPEHIEKKLESITDRTEKIDFLLHIANIFTIKSGIYSVSRNRIMILVANKYSELFEEKTFGYFDFYKKTSYFIGEKKIPISFSIEKKICIEEISSIYHPTSDNVRLLIENYPIKNVASIYSKRMKKRYILSALIDLGFSIEDLRKEKINISQELYDELVGW